MTPTGADRFWAKVDRSGGHDACWMWLAGVARSGYGVFGIQGKPRLAHRVCYRNTRGPIPSGLHVLHSCDNPLCVNPSHLWLGTNLDNVADKVAKGRQAAGERSGGRTHPERLPRGETHPSKKHHGYAKKVSDGLVRFYKQNPHRKQLGEAASNAKLTQQSVLEIRRRYSAGGVSLRALASEFGMSYTAIQAIASGKAWPHVMRPAFQANGARRDAYTSPSGAIV